MLNWYALYVKSRHEFVTNHELAQRGFETYLPSVKKLRQWKDRTKLVDFPLFPGYLFVYMTPQPEEYLKVLKTRGSVTFISLQPGCPTPVAPGEIDSLRMLIDSGKEFNIYPDLKEGITVRIKRGPLKGAEGVLTKKEIQYLFHVNVNLLGRSVSVKINADDLEAA